MSGKIFSFHSGGELRELTQSHYSDENFFQELIEKYPAILAGDQINPDNPRQFVLISREMGVPSEQDGGAHWFLDHLFIDQDAIPTFVEVKRSTDTRIRREVVAQMLDYAANATQYWPIDLIQENYEKVDNTDNDELFERTKDEVIQLLRKTIRPEFLNRIDEILMFKPLSKAEIREIVMMQINHLKALLSKNEVEIKLTNYALDALADMGYDPQFGARPLKRVVQKNILNNLSKMILSDSVRKDVPITIDVIDEQFVFYNEKEKQ